MRIILPVVLAIALAVGCAPAAKKAEGQGPESETAQPTRHYGESVFKLTAKELFGIEMLVKGGELEVGGNSLDLILHDSQDRDVVGAQIDVVPWMPDMGHGVKAKPTVKDMGGGLYRVSDLVITMGGRWQLRVKVEAQGMADEAIFDFPSVGGGMGDAGMEGGQMGHMQGEGTGMPMSGEDLSTTRMSQKGDFRVSYTSDPEAIPLNRIHSWVLTVQKPDGTPVTGAKISIAGDMPAHGHGLPTEPEVTEEMGGGRYLVEGMKFHMQGFWVVTFTIEGGGKSDSATFNVNVR